MNDKPTYEELEAFVRAMEGHDSYWWQEAPEMAEWAEELVKGLDYAARNIWEKAQ